MALPFNRLQVGDTTFGLLNYIFEKDFVVGVAAVKLFNLTNGVATELPGGAVKRRLITCIFVEDAIDFFQLSGGLAHQAFLA